MEALILENVEEEIFLSLYFDPHSKDGKVHVYDKLWLFTMAFYYNVNNI